MVLSAVQNAARARTATTTDARIVNQTKTTKTVNQKKSTQKNKRKDKERRENTSFDDAILTSTLFLMTHIL